MEIKFSMVLSALVMFSLMLTPVALAQNILDETDELTLEDYPDIFFDKDTPIELILGSKAAASDTLGAIDIITNLQYSAKEEVEIELDKGSVVSDGVMKEIAFGESLTPKFKTELKESDGLDLFDGKIKYGSDDISVHEEIRLGDIDVAYSGINNKDYELQPALRIHRRSIKYCFVFDEDVIFEDELKINFANQDLEILSIGNNELSVLAGINAYVNVGETVKIEDMKVTLENVGLNSIIVGVDGVEEIIGEGSSENINGLQITVNTIFYANEKSERGAELTIGEETEIDMVNNADATLFGQDEDEDEVEWVYDIQIENSTHILEDNFICLEYNQKRNEPEDDEETDTNEQALFEGDTFELPGDKGILEFSGVTTPNKIEFTLEEFSDSDIPTAIFELISDKDEGLNVTDEYDKVYIDSNYQFIDEDSIGLGTAISMSDNQDVLFSIDSVAQNLTISTGIDNIVVTLGSNDIVFVYYETNDLSVGKDLSERDESVLTKYGVEIEDVEKAIEDNKLSISIPIEQILTQITIGTSSGDLTSDYTIEQFIRLDIRSKLDNEGYGVNSNLIVVGGPCVNSVYESILNIDCEDWHTNYQYGEGTAFINIVDTGEGIAILVAGTSAADTRFASRVLANFDDYDLEGTNVRINTNTGEITKVA